MIDESTCLGETLGGPLGNAGLDVQYALVRLERLMDTDSGAEGLVPLGGHDRFQPVNWPAVIVTCLDTLYVGCDEVHLW
jgi:hypothetical protein